MVDTTETPTITAVADSETKQWLSEQPGKSE
jgi:hypothetical protein